MATLEIPTRQEARTKVVEIPAKTRGEDGEAIETVFQAELPADLASAIGLEGEREVFRKYVNAKVIGLQAAERRKLVGKETKSRSKAKYIEELGL